MPRRPHASPDSQEPPKKKSSSGGAGNTGLKQGEILTDNTGKRWRLGKPVGIGGFGEIYDVSDNVAREVTHKNCRYVAKIEKHTNGPLFVEINCYLRLGKMEMIDRWKKERCLDFLGLPHFVASGSHVINTERYRFLILPKYHKDLENILQEKKLFNLKTVLVVAYQIVDILEYIHSHGYVHSDIKASNIMLGNETKQVCKPKTESLRKMPERRLKNVCARPVRTSGRTLRPGQNLNYLDDIPFLDDVLNEYKNSKKNVKNKKVVSNGDQIFLLDYGLASKYLLSDGTHRAFSSDQRKAHAGTILFCSRDAHKGVPSRRSDLESLGYNIIYWLTGSLPWINDVHLPEIVEKKKNKCFGDIKMFLEVCFEDCPRFLHKLFNYINKLEFEENPDYNYCRSLFKKTLKEYGYKDDCKLDFDGLNRLGSKSKKIKKNGENKNKLRSPTALFRSPCLPLHSNIIFKRPKLRKKIKNTYAKDSMMNWSRILTDPETILKQAAHKRSVADEPSPSVLEIDLDGMNPTPAMRDVYDRACERGGSSPPNITPFERSEPDHMEGYTPEMMKVHRRMMEQKELELLNHGGRSHVRKTRKCRKRSDSHSRKAKCLPLKRSYSLRG